jgi:hypothetical protein
MFSAVMEQIDEDAEELVLMQSAVRKQRREL